jgi:hypothetical protein
MVKFESSCWITTPSTSKDIALEMVIELGLVLAQAGFFLHLTNKNDYQLFVERFLFLFFSEETVREEKRATIDNTQTCR